MTKLANNKATVTLYNMIIDATASRIELIVKRTLRPTISDKIPAAKLPTA